MSSKILFVFFAVLFLSGTAFAANLEVTSASYDPAPALPGQPMKIIVTLKNNGPGDTENTVLELDLTGGKTRETPYPFSLGTDVSNSYELGSIKSSRSATVRFDVQVDPKALNGDYIISFKYGEKNQPKDVSNKTITILSRKPQIELIRSDIGEAKAGETTMLNLTIRNVGNDNAQDVLVGFEEDRTVTSTGIVVERQIIPIGASYQYVESVSPGEQKTMSFSIVANPEATLKTYMLPVTLKYKDENYNDYTDTRYIGMKIVQEPELSTVIGEVSPAAFPGGTSEISFDLFNTGIGPAKFVVATPSASIGKFENGKMFIGTLEADDYDAFRANFTVDAATQPGSYPITVSLEYKDQYGESQTVEKQATLKVLSAAEAQGSLVNPVIILVGIIGFILEILGLIVVVRWGYKRFVKKGK